MTALSNIADFGALSLAQKYDVFDSGLPDAIKALSNQEIYFLLRNIILNSSENSNIRKRALSALTDCVLLRRIKTRQALSVLIDDWKVGEDVFLEAQRLKDLYFYYSEEKQEIEQVYLGALKSSDAELSSEALYQLGLITFQNSIESNSHETRIKLLDESYSYLSSSISDLENRDDARFFLYVISIVRNALSNKWEQIDKDIVDTANILFQIVAKSFALALSPLFISIYRSLNEFSLLRSTKPSIWLDVREKLTELYVHYSELQNQILKERLNQSDLSQLFVRLVSTEYIEPFFALNLQAEVARIEVRIEEVGRTTDEGLFLIYLKDRIADTNFKKKVESQSLKETLKGIFPHRDGSFIDLALSKMRDKTDPSGVINAYYDLLKPTLENFIDTLVHACLRLQGNRLYRGTFSEDDRNTFVADQLTAADYPVRDQTRWSVSAQGLSAGEIDIYVQDKKNYPFAIIEALNLDSLNKSYLIQHIDKLFNYDTVGHEANFILVYCTAKNFREFWDRYVAFIKVHRYKYSFVGFEEVGIYKFANLKIAITKHIREGQVVLLYHIALDVQ
jgi:hypothetical protein